MTIESGRRRVLKPEPAPPPPPAVADWQQERPIGGHARGGVSCFGCWHLLTLSYVVVTVLNQAACLGCPLVPCWCSRATTEIYSFIDVQVCGLYLSLEWFAMIFKRWIDLLSVDIVWREQAQRDDLIMRSHKGLEKIKGVVWLWLWFISC